jgi:LDH2 family malate/lactate/ureidoglycolate dehydrogenase
VTGERYGYYFIAIDEWLIAEDKQAFLANFMNHINAVETARDNRNAVVPARTATKIRSRPRVFRVTASPL